jgi:uncharacterized membrane protein YebE (DUF533 family)
MTPPHRDDHDDHDDHDDLDDLDLTIDVSFEHDQAVICCRILKALMMVDDDFSEREQVFLANTMSQLGLSPEQRAAAALPMTTAEVEAAAPLLEPDVKKALLAALFQVALVDGHLASAEMSYINQVKRLFGE